MKRKKRHELERFTVRLPGLYMLEASDAARHAQHIALRPSLYRSGNNFGYARGIDAALEAIHP